MAKPFLEDGKQAAAGAVLTRLVEFFLVRPGRLATVRLIGTNDLWIAAASLAHDLPLVKAKEG